MVVVVENGLENFKEYLRKSGFVVVDEKYRGIVDACVYKTPGKFCRNEYDNFTQSSIINSGILMVNVANKTPYDALKILESKIYGDILNFH